MTAAAWIQAVVNGLWQGIVLVVLTTIALRFAGRRIAASARYGIWWTTLFVVAFLPVWALAGPAGRPVDLPVFDDLASRFRFGPGAAVGVAGARDVRSAGTRAVAEPSSAGFGQSSGDAGVAAATGTVPVVRAAAAEPGAGMGSTTSRNLSLTVPQSVPALLAAVHAIVVLVLLGFMVRAITRVRRLRATMRLLPRELRGVVAQLRSACAVGRPVRVGVSDGVAVPVTLGFRDPVVLIPSALLPQLSMAELSQVLVHELAHVARRDDWARLGQHVLNALFFFHPAMHWSAKQLELERELACDDWVLMRTGAPRRSYASCLLRVGELAASGPGLPAAALSMASQLRVRVESLLASPAPPAVRSGRIALACAVLGLPAAAIATGALPAVSVAVTGHAGANRDNATTASVADPASAHVAARLRSLLLGYEAFGFHGAALIVHRGRVLLNDGFGMADRAGLRRWTPETAFNGGAVAKMLTAAAILKLEEEGRLRVADRVADHLGPFPAPKSDVTLHHLLTHTGGLARQWAAIDRSERDDFIEAIRQAPADYPAGGGHRYTDHGHALLAAIIETASGMTYEQYVRTALLEPAGLTATHFENEPPPDAPLAVEYVQPAGAESRITNRPYTWGRRGAMGVITTLHDMYRWHLAIEDGRILGAAARSRMFTGWVDAGRPTRLGYGWEVGRSDRGTRIRHRLSAWPGNSVEIVYDLDEDLFIALVANSPADWGRPKYIDLVNASLGLSHLQTPAPRSTKFDKLDQLAGRYANQGATFDFLPAAPGTLRIDAAGTAAAALFGEQPITVIARATGDRSFAVLQWSRHRMIEFRFDSAGAIAITASGVTHTATRID